LRGDCFAADLLMTRDFAALAAVFGRR